MKADRAKSKTESDIMRSVVENPVLGKYFNSNNFDVILADKNREELKNIYGGGGGLEAWDKNDEGVGDYTHPNFGKYTIEVYDEKLKNNPEELRGAVFRDTLHFLDEFDPKWKLLKKSFVANFSSSEKRFLQNKYMKLGIHKKMGFNEWMNWSVVDGYIRGGFDEPSEFGNIYNSGNTEVYTPKQRKIIEQMKNYLNIE